MFFWELDFMLNLPWILLKYFTSILAYWNNLDKTDLFQNEFNKRGMSDVTTSATSSIIVVLSVENQFF